MRQKKIHYIYNDAMECMDFDERKKLQGERLRATVELEYNNVPAYRKRMDEAGVKPEDINGIEDIVKLPFTQKTDLRDNFPYGLFAADLKDIVRIQGSSGTTGKPIVSGYTENDIKVWTEMVARALTAAGGTKDDIIQIAYGYGLFTGGLGAHQEDQRADAIIQDITELFRSFKMMIYVSHFSSKLEITFNLSATFAPPRIATNGLTGFSTAFPRKSISFCIKYPTTAVSTRPATPTFEQ